MTTIPELITSLNAWADQATKDATDALAEDRLGRFARLSGTAVGFRVAAEELAKIRDGGQPS